MWRLSNQHYASYKFWIGEKQQRRRETLNNIFEASQANISVNAELLEPSVAFLYLSRTVAFNKSNWTALYHNPQKSWPWCGMVAKMLMSTGAKMRA